MNKYGYVEFVRKASDHISIDRRVRNRREEVFSILEGTNIDVIKEYF